MFKLTYKKPPLLKIKIILMFVILAITSTITTSKLNYISITRAVEEEVKKSFDNVISEKAQNIKEYLESALSYLLIAAEQQELTYEVLVKLKNVSNDYDEIFVLNSAGIVIASSNIESIGIDKSNDEYYINRSEEPYTKGIYYSDSAHKLAFAFSMPQGESNLLVARMNTDILNKILLDKNGLGETGEAYLINEDKFLLTPSRFLNNSVLAQIVDSEISEACITGLNKTYGNIDYIDYRGELVIGTYYKIPEMNWCLIGKMDYNEVFKTLLSTSETKLYVDFLVILVASILGSIVGTKIQKNRKNPEITKALMLIAIPTIIFLSATGSSIVYLKVLRLLDDLNVQRQLALSSTLSSKISQRIYSAKNNLLATAEQQEITKEELSLIKSLNSNYVEISVLDLEGRILESTEEKRKGNIVIYKNHFLEGHRDSYDFNISFSDVYNIPVIELFALQGENHVVSALFGLNKIKEDISAGNYYIIGTDNEEPTNFISSVENLLTPQDLNTYKNNCPDNSEYFKTKISDTDYSITKVRIPSTNLCLLSVENVESSTIQQSSSLLSGLVVIFVSVGSATILAAYIVSKAIENSESA